MRDIKFRAWDITEHRMYLHFTIPRLIGNLFTVRTIIRQKEANEELIWMQYTGLKDKGGREIYEGDILRDNEGNIGQVVWAYYKWECILYPTDEEDDGPIITDTGKNEVIGNIYQHPALLKQ